MINKFEAIGISISVIAMVVALYLTRVESTVFNSEAIVADSQQGAVIVAGDVDENTALARAILDASSPTGVVNRMIIDDIIIGSGDAVAEGDTVEVHYIGALQNGQQFDNSYLTGIPFTFTVGEGRVIDGWEQGIVGMMVGGQRIIVIPSELGYGDTGFGPIPGDATLVYSIELLSIN